MTRREVEEVEGIGAREQGIWDGDGALGRGRKSWGEEAEEHVLGRLPLIN